MTTVAMHPFNLTMISPNEFVYEIPEPSTDIKINFKNRMVPGKVIVKLFDNDKIEWEAILKYSNYDIIILTNDNSPFSGTVHIYT